MYMCVSEGYNMSMLKSFARKQDQIFVSLIQYKNHIETRN